MNISSRQYLGREGSATQAQVLVVAELSTFSPNSFSFRPARRVLRALAREVGAMSVAKLRFEGAISAFERRDWKLLGRLQASVRQQCVISFRSVPIRVGVDVTRTFVADHSRLRPSADWKIPDDDSMEPLNDQIDLLEIVREVLVLELPLYPHAKGVDLGNPEVSNSVRQQEQDIGSGPLGGLAELLKSNQV